MKAYFIDGKYSIQLDRNKEECQRIIQSGRLESELTGFPEYRQTGKRAILQITSKKGMKSKYSETSEKVIFQITEQIIRFLIMHGRYEHSFPKDGTSLRITDGSSAVY